MKKNKESYIVKHYDEILETYHDRDFAIHSAQCFASFYRITTVCVEKSTGNVISVKQPK